jgi:putative ABC transport system substrate-binding protein
MRRIVLLILALATLLPSQAQAYDLLVLQSSHNPAYEEVMKGFLAGGDLSKRVIVMTDYSEVDVVRIVREDRPGVILAVGDTAVTAARTVTNTPVVAVMSLGIHNQNLSRTGLTGVSMFAAPHHYIDIFKKMQARRVGIIYNKARTGWYLKQCRKDAEAAGIELVTCEVSAPRDTIRQLTTLTGKIDAIWMLPDTTAVTSESAESYFLFGQQHNIPVVSFSSNYLKLGAAVALDIERSALGRQARIMATKLLAGDTIGNLTVSYPDGIAIKTNSTVLKRLGSAYAAPLEFP